MFELGQLLHAVVYEIETARRRLTDDYLPEEERCRRRNGTQMTSHRRIRKHRVAN
jgi:hypothetical protein